jgi:hypothetical protein
MADGAYESKLSLPKNSGKGKLSAEQLGQLTKAVGQQDWPKVPAKLMNPYGADMFHYDISVRIGPKTHKVLCDDTIARKYPALRSIIGTLGSVG